MPSWYAARWVQGGWGEERAYVWVVYVTRVPYVLFCGVLAACFAPLSSRRQLELG